MSYWETIKAVFTSKEGKIDLVAIIVGVILQLFVVNKVLPEKFVFIGNIVCFVVVMLSISDLFSKITAIATREAEAERKAKQQAKHPKKK